ncbi:hypothetical protein G4G28_00140 [Massilia sp. Dwa41.01b]|uniref:ArsI/CadI family heavy metal resistance metalloenzyme n=1 Tax=unclassified Massilia TaxID=2609279 RepID=UPI0016009663|nr:MULTISPECIES: ArsI/CadI family heavy metal resistance metalloenzyme [unclassified Massilia]QNA87264.1 hypothetical protein G4G28_00140 [Massilia sp. Dwa41.01b]QNA98168.1 hypothetical protein G4G31_03895 [Massilia sp. Se16.2.3]
MSEVDPIANTGSSCCPPRPGQAAAASCCAPSAAAPSAAACCAPAPSQAAGCGGAVILDDGTDEVSAVDFPNERRIHISLNVRNLKKSLWFYRILFNRNPSKLREDYAKFEPTVPPVNFTLNEHADAIDRDGHFGIEVKSTEAVQAVINRMTAAGMTVNTRETQVSCCYSVQDKVWVVDPDGNHWEVFVVTNSEAVEGCGLSCICYDKETGGCNWKSNRD